MDYGPVNSGVKDIAEMSDFLGRGEREYASKFILPSGSYDVESIAPVENKVFAH